MSIYPGVTAETNRIKRCICWGRERGSNIEKNIRAHESLGFIPIILKCSCQQKLGNGNFMSLVNCVYEISTGRMELGQDAKLLFSKWLTLLSSKNHPKFWF